MSVSFTAIDFETANSNSHSVCQVGMAKVLDGKVVDTYSSLILPPTGVDSFKEINISIHHIRPEDVFSAPSWLQVYEEMRQFINSDVLLAHNAPFDRGCLVKTNDYFGIDDYYDFICTVSNSRRLLPDLVNHRLPTVAQHFSIKQENHHDAAEDAIVAAEIGIRLADIGDLKLLNAGDSR
jgi:DNA polymerase-3 subunit epsilon